jgi:hypothetical protein
VGVGILEDWEREVGDVSDETIAAIRALPQFSDAVRTAVRQAIAHLKADPAQHANFRDSGRMILAMLALYLDATGGLTHRRLRDLSANSGALSAGRATAMLLHLQFIGFATAAPEHRNGMPRVYKPTEPMRRAFRARAQIDLESLAVMVPQVAPLVARFDDAAFKAYVTALGDLMLSLGPRHHEDLKDLDALAGRNSAMLLLYILMDAADDGGAFPRAGKVSISASALARQLNCSRMHVQRVLRDAERAGLVTRDGADGLAVTPLLCEKFSIWIALLFMVVGVIARRTMAALQNQPAAQERASA